MHWKLEAPSYIHIDHIGVEHHSTRARRNSQCSTRPNKMDIMQYVTTQIRQENPQKSRKFSIRALLPVDGKQGTHGESLLELLTQEQSSRSGHELERRVD